jgi:hypothetical protein
LGRKLDILSVESAYAAWPKVPPTTGTATSSGLISVAGSTGASSIKKISKGTHMIKHVFADYIPALAVSANRNPKKI